jgi:DNA modification methylase
MTTSERVSLSERRRRTRLKRSTRQSWVSLLSTPTSFVSNGEIIWVGPRRPGFATASSDWASAGRSWSTAISRSSKGMGCGRPPRSWGSLPALGSAAVSCANDLWLLGEHRLFQGDARDPAAYAQILGEGELARLVLTDEPFNVPNVGHVTSSGHHREFAMANGEMSADEFMAFNQAWMSAATIRLVDGGLMATFIDWRSVELVLACGRQLGLPLINLVVWAKSNGGQGSLWRSQHEPLPFFKKGDAPHVNNIELGRHGRWRSNVWTYPGASSLGSDARDGLAHHPTVKPRALLEDALLDVINRGDIVLEPFAGSGSTLLAAEAVGRMCRAIEIDALYCDLTIQRWQQMTGQEARLSETGETFAQVRTRRLGEGCAQAAYDANGADLMRDVDGDDEQT